MSRVTNPFAFKKNSSTTNDTQNSPFEKKDSNNIDNFTNLPPKSQTFNKPPKKSEIKQQTNSQETQIQSPYHNNNINNKTNSINNSTENNFTQENKTKPNNNINSISHYDLNSMLDEETNDIITIFNNSLKQFNCSSDFIKCTHNYLPNSEALISQMNVPIGLNIGPLSPNISPENIPKIDYGENELPRCENKSCRAYLNPFIKFFEGGQKWVCNFCHKINETKDYYFNNLDNYNERIDKFEKTELCNGSYEFLTNKTYWKTNIVPYKPNYIFVIDVSNSSIKSGFLTSIINSIKDAINNEIFFNYNLLDIKISIITFDNNIQFYSIDKRNNHPMILEISSKDLFIPTLQENLLFSIKENKDKILTILDTIENNYANGNFIKDSESLFSTIEIIKLLLTKSGGQVCLFSGSNNLNNLNFMHDKNIEIKKKEDEYYRATDGKLIGNIGIKLTNLQIKIDLFVSANSYTNLFTLNQICEYTNGNLFFYRKFNFNLHYKNIFNQIRRVLSREICFDAVIKTRFSHNFKIREFITPVLLYNNDLFVCPNHDSDQHYQVIIDINKEKENNENNQNNTNNNQINNNNNINNNINISDYMDINLYKNYIYIQTSILYSYGDGNRRIRIHNLCVPCIKNIKQIFEGIDSEAIAVLYMKKIIDSIYRTQHFSNSVLEVENMFYKLINNYFEITNNKEKKLSENLMYLPIYMLGIMKQRIFCKNEIEKKYDMDLSNYIRIKVIRFSLDECLSFIYPRIYNLTELYENEEIGNYNNETNFINLPNLLADSINSISNDGLYLIDNGYLIILYVRQNNGNEIIKSLFDVEEIKDYDKDVNESIFDNCENGSFKERIYNIIEYIRSTKSLFQNLIFIFSGTPSEKLINEALIEDNCCSWYPYDYEKFYKKMISSGLNSSIYK